MPSSTQAGAVVYAKDMGRVVAFYRAVLQADTLELEPEYTVLQAPGMQLIVHAIPAHIANTFEIATPPEPREEQAIKLFFNVPSIAAAREAAAATGGSVAGSAWQGQGFTACNAMDPGGNILQVREAVSAA